MPVSLWASTEGLVLPTDQLKGQLEFCDLSFAYPTRKEAPIFQNLSLVVPAGTIMAVVGPSGSGKSTLVSLLLRLYDPDAGETDLTLKSAVLTNFIDCARGLFFIFLCLLSRLHFYRRSRHQGSKSLLA